MFKCLGLDSENRCIAQPEYGVLHGDICGTCQKKGLRKCRFMKIHEKRDEKCGCYWIICENPESPICGDENVWYDKKCNINYCRFFSSK